MTAVPSRNAVTLPLASTLITCGLSLDHVTALFVALEGSIVARRTSLGLAPVPLERLNVRDSLFRVIDETGTETVTSHFALPSPDFTVIIVLPPARAVTRPFSSTEATLTLLLVQTAVRSVVSGGSTVNSSV